MSDSRHYKVLFLCTGNSARSLIGEAILNRLGASKFVGLSAGSQPKGAPHPQTLALLKRLNHPIDGLRSKSWEEFAAPGAPELDFVFTVCDRAASEVCPVWPGQPLSAHWGIPDPAADEGAPAQIAAAFVEAYRMLTARITAFVNLPIESLDRLSLQARMDAIGRDGGAPSSAADALDTAD